jgi:GntR family transcriptional repressor for pyruvate dehydrogenase complex
MTDITDRQAELRFHHISAARAHEEVIGQITFAIRSGLLKPGDRLPTIEVLAEMTDVSKPVIGEAVRVLRDHGVLESKRGVQGGVSVVSEDIPVTLIRRTQGWRGAAVAELVEARRPVEMELALLAGQRATAYDIEQMRQSIVRYEEAVAEGADDGAIRHLNHLFHYSFGSAAKSEMLAYYQHQILGEIAVLLHDYYISQEDPGLVIKTHWATLEAIESRSEKRIRKAMNWHLENLEQLAASPMLAEILENPPGG